MTSRVRAVLLSFLCCFCGGLEVLGTTTDTPAGSGISPVVDLAVPEVIYATQLVTFNCSANGVGVANYSWSRDGLPLAGGHEGQLTVTIFLAWNGSCLTCHVEGDDGAVSNASTIITLTAHSAALVEYPESLTIDEGDALELLCRALGFPTPTVSLRKDTVLVGNLFQLGSSAYTKSAASADDSGDYTCFASNGIGPAAVSPVAVVRVRFAPEITSSPEAVDVLNNSVALLNCSARGDPTPSISWWHNDEPLETRDGRVEVLSNGSLLIFMTMLSDTGDYQCLANNSLGMDQSDEALLMVNVFPVFTRRPSDVNVHLDMPAELVCAAMALPEPSYTWLRSPGLPVPLDSRVMEVNGTLTFARTLREDHGMYICVAMNDYGNTSSLPASLTILAPPLPPEGLRVLAVGSSWVQLAWDPDPAPTLPILGYLLEYRLGFEQEWDMVPDATPILSRNVTGLYPNANYTFRVAALSGQGESQVSGVVEVMTSPGAPTGDLLDAPTQVEVTAASSNSFDISWIIPQVLEQTSYLHTLLTVQNLSGAQVFSAVATSSPASVAAGLLPATNYSLAVTLVFVGGQEGTPVTLFATTMDAVPGDAPTMISSFALGPGSLRVLWGAPSLPNGAITAFTIYYSPPSSNVTVGGAARSHDLDMLSAYTEYSISLSAHTSAGEGPVGPQGGVAVFTDQDVPPAPAGVGVASLNSTAIAVTWQQFNEGTVPGILVNFTICYNQLHHGGHAICEEAGSNDTLVEIGGLAAYTVYSVRVGAATEAGLGMFTDKLRTRTFGDVPGAGVGPLVVMEVCPAGGLMLEWSLPSPRLLGGPEEEVQYLLFYTPNVGVASNLAFSYNSSLTSYLLEEVLPFTNYTVSLALQNRNGTGQVSIGAATSCDAAAPPPVAIVAGAVTSSSIEVLWGVPDPLPGQLRGYVLRYGENGEQSNMTDVSPSVDGSGQWVIRGLEPFTDYYVSVATQTRGPLGVFSDARVISTLGDVPVDVVANVVAVAACPANLLVEWSPLTPRQLRAPPNSTFYLLAYNFTALVDQGIVIPYLDGPVANVAGLQLDTVYSVTVVVVNEHGRGPDSPPLNIRTLQEGVPAAPSNVEVTDASSSALNVTWLADPPYNYTVHYEPASTADLSLVEAWPRTSPQASPPALLENLQPFTIYSIVVMATTLCGSTPSALVTGTTSEAPPTVPLNLAVAATLPTGVRVQWSSPASPNGILTHYNVYCSPGVLAVRVASSLLSYECGGLEPEMEYSLNVSAQNGAGEGPAVSVSATTSCSLATPTTQQQEEGVVVIALPTSCSISVDFFLVVVQELVSYANATYERPARAADSYGLQELLELTENYRLVAGGRGRRMALNEGGGVYIAANLTEEEFSSGFMLGDDTLTYQSFRNHPLLPGVYYQPTLRATVPGTDTLIYTSSPSPITRVVSATTGVSATATGVSSFPLVPVVAGAGAALLLSLAIFMAALISCICCCCHRSLDKVDGVTGIRIERTGSFRASKRKLVDPVEDFRANNKTEVLEDHPPVPVHGFINKLMVMRTNDNQLFLEEFGSIPMTMAHLATDVASLHAHKPKNRYYNILPYDVTRVKLKGHSGDYINANYCSGYRKTKAYIATQGPVQETLGDFWRMVWDENVRTVVMLTNVQEKGKIKCEMYWPREVGSSCVHGQVEVSLTAVTTLADYCIRNFALHKVGSSKEPREVVQFHFTTWPDHGVPQYATAMLAMLRRVRALYSSEEGPMLVHCSAGVGRTGTFIAIDTMLQRLMHEEELLDIYGHLTLLRSQRNYMIQTEDQYFFVHEAIAEALLCGNTEITLENLPGYVQNLCSVIPDDESETTNLELQFKRLALDRNDPHRWMTANKDANKAKNRFVNVLPYDSSRVCLEYSPGVDGSDYINASHVDSYHHRRAFIATQGPLNSTVVDFWRMLWQYSAPVVVMLTAEMERGRECSAGYWPGAILQPITYGKLSVELNVERNSGSYSYRDLCVTNSKDDKKRLVRQFQFHDWPEVGVPSPAVLIEFIREVQKLCQSLPSTHGPIVVHCSNGVGRTGVFLSLHIILERMLAEGFVDVFQTVKNLRIQRPAMVQTLEQYHFCYDAAVTFLQSTELLSPHPPQPLLTRQRNSSQRGSSHLSSRHGSHSSVDSRKKNKTLSPSASPSRSISQQRSTPMRSESFKDSPRGTMEMKSAGPGPVGAAAAAAQVYGGSDATSTFGSHPPPDNLQAAVAMEAQNPLNGMGNHSNLVPTAPPVLPGSNTPVLMASHAPTPPYGANVPAGSNTPLAASHAPTPPYGANVPAGSNTPVLMTSQAPYGGAGSNTPVLMTSQAPTPPYGAGAAGSNTPVLMAPTPPSYTPVQGGSHTPVASLAQIPPCGSQSPVAAGLEMPPQMFAGSQMSMFTGSQTPGFGSQTLSLFSGSQTPPLSRMSLSSNNSQQGHMHYHHQLLETQRCTPNSLPDRAVGAESTPL